MITQEVFYHFGNSEPELLVVEVAGTVTPGCGGMRVKLRLSATGPAAILWQDIAELLSLLPPVLLSLRKRYEIHI